MVTKKLKERVRDLMKEDVINRNSDNWLVINTLRELGFKIDINIDEIGSMPSFESITRIRRHIQHIDKEFLPTDEVAEARIINEEKVREEYNPKYLTGGLKGVFNNLRTELRI